ncbi:3-oxoacyl-[acyl-carrier-protein] reductase [Macrococcoides canis]|uniref:3-oxoacyl-[acyl-carrier-protein] reductase n=1 Tax=Macrococcoides canis TaxID=1855823 RepID=A0A1W7AAT2_9STAP|nr:3-oxoacyl-[acyl-carrier-protein] reductase [Macrococcus canis]ARQ06701.1 3-oxoacyl-[acyl-carrier-protein] reductase FabG [Macrococcus canis]UJS28783.1 3-oxoacyl-[acyl-carrier-protein] reductase [Macrococcus canis]UTH01017.1 3-oxoacyl-[acyl-carrier-protein] reductase [Macrococcus canis]UTH12498.1 3-oxoacyl-[acyl-carrier-protein] reductase [Macrococcus canis]WBF51961.1 3-oxoacyl-[acyl-carrier-protein] reductase [Macrococcus canis]
MKTALVTGSSRGIGRSIALALADEGFNIIVNYSGNEQKAQQVVQEIIEKGQKAVAVKADVSNFDEVKAMIDEGVATFGSLDCIVNNAGITRDNLAMRMKREEFTDVIDTNLTGVFNVIQAASRQLLRQRAGTVINVSSIVASIGNAGQVNYVAAKAGVEGMTKTFAREFASRGIRVNAVAPGFIKSDMTDVLDDSLVQTMKSQIPLGEMGQPEDVAHMVAFLASDKAQYITGQTFHVNGGMFMQ